MLNNTNNNNNNNIAFEMSTTFCADSCTLCVGM